MEPEDNKPITKFQPLNFLRIPLFSHQSRQPCPLSQFTPLSSPAWIQKEGFINQELIGTSQSNFPVLRLSATNFPCFSRKIIALKYNLITLSPYFKNSSMALDYLQDNYDFSPKVLHPQLVPVTASGLLQMLSPRVLNLSAGI